MEINEKPLKNLWTSMKSIPKSLEIYTNCVRIKPNPTKIKPNQQRKSKLGGSRRFRKIMTFEKIGHLKNWGVVGNSGKKSKNEKKKKP